MQGDLIYVGMRGAMRAISKTNGDLVWSWYDPDGASVNAGPEVVRIPGRETEEPYVIFCTDAGRLITLQAQVCSLLRVSECMHRSYTRNVLAASCPALLSLHFLLPPTCMCVCCSSRR